MDVAFGKHRASSSMKEVTGSDDFLMKHLKADKGKVISVFCGFSPSPTRVRGSCQGA